MTVLESLKNLGYNLISYKINERTRKGKAIVYSKTLGEVELIFNGKEWKPNY